MTSDASRPRCRQCGLTLGDQTQACPSCGAAPASALPLATQTAVLSSAPQADPPAPTPAGTGPITGSPPGLTGGFAPGTLFAGRYRIVSPLGRGGMGIVYRAEDLRLGQTVALKFLPPGLEADAQRLATLHAEVRNARLVSHPNVCRVFDVGDSEGHHFLSMEYVDGEDLASLLKRIGRLPAAKALDLARELCAGLAAAHERGVIHRDLKPANVMVDGHGRARVADFGLALGLEQEGRPGELAGTPQYMAPEQLAGHGATVRSDIYALGLVLYELFTGRRAFEARTIPEMLQKQSESAVPPSRYAGDLEPAVERLILQCLSPDPGARPASVAQIAAALPGGDPLLGAIAGGHTPSPEMVAAAATVGDLSVAGAWSALGGFAALITLCVALAPQATLLGVVRPPKSPEALAERARSLIADVGYREPTADSVQRLLPDVERLLRGGPDAAAGVRFFYRQSPEALVSFNPLRPVSPTNPPLSTPGMVNVELDPTGRLLRFEGKPETAAASGSSAETDWAPLLRAAGLEPASFSIIDSTGTPSVPFDTRREWREHPAASAAAAARVRGASLAGRPVFFEVDLTPRAAAAGPARSERARPILGVAFVVVVLAQLVAATYFARRNIRLGRGDTRGALRVAATGAALHFASAALGSHHAYASAMDFFWWFRGQGSSALWVGTVLWLMYVALEPYARRQWPHLLVGWSRLLAGRARDPQVGRDLLWGAMAGAGVAATTLAVGTLRAYWVGAAPSVWPDLRPLLGTRAHLGAALYTLSYALIGTLLATAALAVGHAVLRRRLAGVALAALILLVSALQNATPWSSPRADLSLAVVTTALEVAFLVRFGALAWWAMAFVGMLLTREPIHLDLGSWYAGTSLLTLAMATSVAVYGFVTSLAGRPLLGAPEGDK